MSARPPQLDDDRDIFALVCAYNEAIVGIPDYTLEEVRDELSRPHFVPDTDGWLVHDGDRAIGYAVAELTPDSDRVAIDVLSLDADVAAWLLDRAVERAREVGRERGHPRVTVDHSTYRDDEQLHRLLAQRGFSAATSFYRMRIDHHGPVDEPVMPPGVGLRSCAEGDAVRRAAHDVREESFVEHYGHTAEPYEEWVTSLEYRTSFSWEHVRLAEDDGEPVGMIRVSDQFVEDERCGYVAQIGVLPSARGRGIAKAMLRSAFAADAARGLDGTLLHVDSSNTTPALGLYQSVGMRTILVIEAWSIELAP